jgi:hypothetical protein
MFQEIQLGDIVRLRKPHPCGGFEWRVTRLGADIGLECLTCGHHVMLTRRETNRRIKIIVSRGKAETNAAR